MMAWQHNIIKKIESWMVSNGLYFPNEHSSSTYKSAKDKDPVCLFWSWYIYHWIKPLGKNKTKQNKEPLTFLFCICSCPQIPTFLTERGMYANLIFSFINDDFRLNPLVLGADIFQRRLWSPGGRGPLLRQAGVLPTPWSHCGDVL